MPQIRRYLSSSLVFGLLGGSFPGSLPAPPSSNAWAQHCCLCRLCGLHSPQHPCRLVHILAVAGICFVRGHQSSTSTNDYISHNKCSETWRTRISQTIISARRFGRFASAETSGDSRLRAILETLDLPPSFFRILMRKLYNVYVIIIVLYDCGTGALIERDIGGLEAYHRSHLRRLLRIHLRRLLRIHYVEHISNVDLYKWCRRLNHF